MQPTRRSLAEAVPPPRVSPEALAFIKAGTPTPQTPSPILTTGPAKPAPEKAAMPIVQTPPAPKTRIQSEQTAEQSALVSTNYRLPAIIPSALLKASSDRKLKKVRPFTQQDIVAEALTAWLKKNGYWPHEG